MRAKHEAEEQISQLVVVPRFAWPKGIVRKATEIVTEAAALDVQRSKERAKARQVTRAKRVDYEIRPQGDRLMSRTNKLKGVVRKSERKIDNKDRIMFEKTSSVKVTRANVVASRRLPSRKDMAI